MAVLVGAAGARSTDGTYAAEGIRGWFVVLPLPNNYHVSDCINVMIIKSLAVVVYVN